MDNLQVEEEKLHGLRYRRIRRWDSVGHMGLVAEIEETFDIAMSTIDVLNFTSYEKGIELLKQYGVEIEA